MQSKCSKVVAELVVWVRCRKMLFNRLFLMMLALNVLLCIIVYQIHVISKLKEELAAAVVPVVQTRSVSADESRSSISVSLPSSTKMSEEIVAVKMKIQGVAVTTFLGAPKWFQNRYTMMINQMLAILPEDWVVQIFYNPKKGMAVEGINYPGIQRHLQCGRLIITEIPTNLTKLKKNELMLNPWLWRSVAANNVLTFGGNSVLCANTKLPLENFVGKFQYIGAPWGEFNGMGGSGGLSLRNRTKVLEVVTDIQNSGMKLKGKREDSLIVKHLLLDSNNKIASPKVVAAYPLPFYLLLLC